MMAPMALMIGGMALSAIGSMQQANAQASALKGQAGIADRNATISRVNAEEALKTSSAAQLAQRRQARQEIGRQRAFAAQSGTGAGGTNKDLLDRSNTLAELDALNIAYEGAVKSRGYLMQADMDAYTANLYRDQAKNVKRAGLFSTVGSIAGGFGKIGGYT